MVVGLPWVYSCKWINHPPPHATQFCHIALAFKWWKSWFREVNSLSLRTKRTEHPEKPNKKPNESLLKCGVHASWWWNHPLWKKYSSRLGSSSPKGSVSTWKISENTTWTSAGKRQAKILSPWKASTPSSNHGKTNGNRKGPKVSAYQQVKHQRFPLPKTHGPCFQANFEPPPSSYKMGPGKPLVSRVRTPLKKGYNPSYLFIRWFTGANSVYN